MAKILVVDDEPDVQEMIKVALEGAGYEVIVADNGREGVDKARKEKPEGIVLDIMMPEMDGFTACKELKNDPDTENIPILILTGLGEKISSTRYARNMGLSLEADDFLEKPVEPDEMVKRLKEIL
ncbi:MAG: response regulator [Deltaproteobacteria bacterium]|nr:response regulator [Deltaproteobacteria bacterium]MBW2307551.1 response regulator [Deltaproteobacteria bacterium]